MKNKLVKILGVVLTLATITSLFLFASPASAATQAWSKIPLPSATGNVLADFNVLGPIAQALDGAIYMGANAGGFNTTISATTGGLYKSTDFGRTWKLLPAFPNNPLYTGQIFDIATSSVDANIVYVTDGENIYKTINGGTSWITISSLSVALSSDGAAQQTITSISVGYTGSSSSGGAGLSPDLYASTSSFGGGEGGVFVCEEANFNQWRDENIGTNRPENVPYDGVDVARVQVLPDFAATQGIMAVFTEYYVNDNTQDSRTTVSVKFGGGSWDTAVNDVNLEYTVGNNLVQFDDILLSANIYLPSDFNSNPNTGLMQAFIGIDTEDTSNPNGPDDVYLAYFGPAATSTAPNYYESPAFDLNIRGTDSATHISCLDGVGPSTAANIMVSGFVAGANDNVPAVWTTRNSGQTWAPAIKRPTGGASPLYGGFALSVVLVSPDFATSGQALVATHGDDNGVSFTKDFGATFNTISMVASDSDSAIDFIRDISLTSDNTIYATTDDDAFDSAWRHDAAGWERIDSVSLTGGPDFRLIEAVPDNSAVFLSDASGYVWRSLDKGQTWKQQITLNPSGPFDSWLVVNSNSLLIGASDDSGNIYQSTTNGLIWFTRSAFTPPSDGFDVTDIRVASNGDYLAASADETLSTIFVSKSTDGGLTWTSVNTGETATYGALVAPAADYATSGNVFVSSASDGAIWVGTVDIASVWARADGNPDDPASGVIEVQNTDTTGLITSPGGPGAASEGTGMVYATNSEDFYQTQDTGVARIRGSALFAEPIYGPVVGTSTIGLTGLWVGANSVGNVALYTIGSDANIWTYTDTLNKAGSGVSVSKLTPESATVSWTAMPNATSYWVVVSPVPVTSVYLEDLPPGAYGALTTATSHTFTSLNEVTTYYVSVWAFAGTYPTFDEGTYVAVSSFMFSGTFTTPPEVPNYPWSQLVPLAGAQNVDPLLNFQWDAVYGATSYELWLDTNQDMSTAVKYTGIAAPAGNSAGDFSPPAALAYNTLYYWEVRAVTATGHSAWSGVWSFTTMKAPVPPVTVSVAPQPTIIFPTQSPPVTVTVGSPVTPVITLQNPNITLVEPTVTTPTYIWIIVGVGALLTLAVIILIIRTRRVV